MRKSRASDTVFIVAAGRSRGESTYRGPAAAATLIAEAIDVIEYREVPAKLGDMAVHPEMWRHALDGVDQGLFCSRRGYGG